jgi:hypothetical protein
MITVKTAGKKIKSKSSAFSNDIRSFIFLRKVARYSSTVAALNSIEEGVPRYYCPSTVPNFLC